MEVSPFIFFFRSVLNFFWNVYLFFFQDTFSTLIFFQNGSSFTFFENAPWMFFTSKVISWKHFFCFWMEISLFIFLGLQISPFFFSCDFWVFTRKNAEISILNCDFSIIFFGWTNSLFSFFSCDFSVFTRRMNFSLFFWLESSPFFCVQLRFFPVSPEEVKKPAFWIDLNFLLFKLHVLFAPN